MSRGIQDFYCKTHQTIDSYHSHVCQDMRANYWKEIAIWRNTIYYQMPIFYFVRGDLLRMLFRAYLIWLCLRSWTSQRSLTLSVMMQCWVFWRTSVFVGYPFNSIIIIFYLQKRSQMLQIEGILSDPTTTVTRFVHALYTKQCHFNK